MVLNIYFEQDREKQKVGECDRDFGKGTKTIPHITHTKRAIFRNKTAGHTETSAEVCDRADNLRKRSLVSVS